MSTEASTGPAAASAPIPSHVTNQAAAPAPAPAVTPTPAAAPVAPAAGDPAATPAAQPDLARGFASLAAEEKRIRTERDALKSEKTQVSTIAQQLQAARANPREAMRLLGYTDDQVLAALAGDPAPAPAVDDRVARLEQVIAERDARDQAELARQEAARQQQSADQVITNFRNDVHSQLKAGAGDKYALIAAYGAESEVTARIENDLLAGKPMRPWAQVADEVETELEGKARRALETPKLKLVPPSETRNGPPSEQRSPTTLTNRGTTGASANPLPPLPLDPEERTTEILRRRGLAS